MLVLAIVSAELIGSFSGERGWALQAMLLVALGGVIAVVYRLAGYELHASYVGGPPEIPDDPDAWSCRACGAGAPDYLDACWRCRRPRRDDASGA